MATNSRQRLGEELPDIQPIVVRSDADAWDVLQQLMDIDESGSSELPEIIFDGWPAFEVHSKRGHADIGTSTMGGYLALQEAVHRSFNLFERQRRDLRAFTDEDRRRLELVVHVSEGTSGFKVLLEKVLVELVKPLGKKLTPLHLLIGLISVGLIIGGTDVWKHSISERASERKEELRADQQDDFLDHTLAMSQEETKRMALLRQASEKVPDVQAVEAEIEGAREEYLQSLPPGFGVVIEGIEIPPQVLEELVKTERQSTEQKMVTGVYLIDSARSGDADGFDFKVRLKDPESGATFPAEFGELLTSTKVRSVVRTAFFDKAPLVLTLDARKRHGEIVSAKIISAKRAPKPKAKPTQTASTN